MLLYKSTGKSLIKNNSSIVIVFNKTKKEKINRGIEMLGLLFDAYDIDAQNIKIFINHSYVGNSTNI